MRRVGESREASRRDNGKATRSLRCSASTKQRCALKEQTKTPAMQIPHANFEFARPNQKLAETKLHTRKRCDLTSQLEVAPVNSHFSGAASAAGAVSAGELAAVATF